MNQMAPLSRLSAVRRSALRIATFLLLTAFIDAGPYLLMARSGYTRDFALLWMWSPALVALATSLVFDRSIKGLGWKIPTLRNLLIAFAVPLTYSILIHGTVWVTGLGSFQPEPFIRLLLFGSLGLVLACFAALGEDIGWRGLLVPELRRTVTFNKTRDMAIIREGRSGLSVTEGFHDKGAKSLPRNRQFSVT